MDLKNIGLSEKMDIKLKEITSEYFLNELDGYRFAVSLAIFHKLSFKERSLVPYKNKYDVGGVDVNFIFRNTVREIFPTEIGVEYRAIEKLADAGVEFLDNYIEKNSVLDLDDIMKNDT